eukprot:21130-Hanusia_phi.AAC.6
MVQTPRSASRNSRATRRGRTSRCFSQKERSDSLKPSKICGPVREHERLSLSPPTWSFNSLNCPVGSSSSLDSNGMSPPCSSQICDGPSRQEQNS